MIDGKKFREYIKAEINPYGKPFEGTVYEFGLKLMNMLDRMEQDSQPSLTQLERELEVYKKAYSLLIDEVSLERWLNDSQKDKLFNVYLEKVREDNDR